MRHFYATTADSGTRQKFDPDVRRCRLGAMRLLFSAAWSVCCIGVGIAAATINLGGKTGWQHAQQLWVSERAPQLVEEVRGKVVTAVKDVKERPLDRHSPAERDALEKLIANRQNDGK